MTSVRLLARAASRTRWESLTDGVRHQAADLFLDTLGVCAAGLNDQGYWPFAKRMAIEAGMATVPGVETGLSIHAAVLINCGATTVLQLQDGHRMARGHPASHIAPSLLALAESNGADSKAIFSAMVAGYEVGARIGIALDGVKELLHDTGTWSSIGTAVATAHLLSNGQEETIADSIESAAAVALMPYRDLPVQGATSHHLYIGLGAISGLTAAHGAMAGLKPLEGTLERFFGPRSGAAFNARKLTDGIDESGEWSSFEIENAYFKIHPTCAHLHGANDALLSLMQRHDIKAGAIGRVEIATYGASLAFDNATPVNVLAARFSQAACAAIALTCGSLDEKTLTDENLCSPAVQSLMKRVSVVHDPALDLNYPAGRPTRVSIMLEDGNALSEAVVYPLGDHTNPAPRDMLRRKAARLLASRFGEDNTDTIISAFENYLLGNPIGELTAALRSPAHGPA